MFCNMALYVRILKTVTKKNSFAQYSNKVNPTVKIAEGELKGATKKLFDGSSYYSFMGIPYAQTPTGDQRFKAPLPLNPWQGVYEATKHGPVCPQVEMITGNIIDKDENCLYLNVYTKSLQPSDKLPVMVFLHGGGFFSGSGNSDLHGPEYLLQHDVILVTINYRVEVFGFLNIDTPEVPGNAGMKDQVVALRWVQTNIEKFGGDPSNVTLFGESAGGASVTYHMLSKMSKGLFHKAIAQSGVCTSDWAQGMYSVERAFKVGKLLGLKTDNKDNLLKFLRSCPLRDLIKITNKTCSFDEKHRGLPLHFVPVVEKQFEGVEAFLDIEPLKLISEKKINNVPLIIGYNSQEGITLVAQKFKTLDFINKNLTYSIPREIALKVTEEKLKEFSDRVRQFYVGNREFTTKDEQALVDLTSDLNFIYSIHRFANMYSKCHSDLFMYRFDIDTELNVLKKLFGLSHLKGASHVEDLFYIFSNVMTNDLYEEHDRLREIVHRVTKLWTDFAKTSNPTPDNSFSVKWTPYTTEGKEYLNIGRTFKMEKYADKNRIENWNEIYKEAGLPCISES